METSRETPTFFALSVVSFHKLDTIKVQWFWVPFGGSISFTLNWIFVGYIKMLPCHVKHQSSVYLHNKRINTSLAFVKNISAADFEKIVRQMQSLRSGLSNSWGPLNLCGRSGWINSILQPALSHVFIQQQILNTNVIHDYLGGFQGNIPPSIHTLYNEWPYTFNPGLAHLTCFVWGNVNEDDADRGLINTCALGLMPPAWGEMWSSLWGWKTTGREQLSYRVVPAEPILRFTLELSEPRKMAAEWHKP